LYYLNCTNIDSCSQVFKLTQDEFEEHTELIINCPECKSPAILSVNSPLEVKYDDNEIDKLILDTLNITERIQEEVNGRNNPTTKEKSNNKKYSNRSNVPGNS
jgi:hypothetical protein